MLKITVIGHLGMDAKLNEVNGQKVINFSVAESYRYTDNENNKVERTTWVNCQYWAKNTEVVKYLTKGRRVFIEGYPSTKIFTAKDGQKMAGINCRIINIELLDSKEKSNTDGAAATAGDVDEFDAHMNKPDDNCPFD